MKGRLKIFSDGLFMPSLTTASTIGTATAFATIVLKLQLGHDGGVGIMFALLGNVVFIIGHACHEVGGKFGGFPPSGEFTLHLVPPVVCRRGTPPGFLWRSASRLCVLSWRYARRRWQRRRRRRGTMRSDRH